MAIRGVAVLVVQDRKILMIEELTNNSLVGKKKGMFSIPMGRLREGEGYREGALREFREETGLEAVIRYPLGFFEIEANGEERTAVWAFLADLKDGWTIEKHDIDVSDSFWMDKDVFLGYNPLALRPLNHQIYQSYAYLNRLGIWLNDEAITKLVSDFIPEFAR